MFWEEKKMLRSLGDAAKKHNCGHFRWKNCDRSMECDVSRRVEYHMQRVEMWRGVILQKHVLFLLSDQFGVENPRRWELESCMDGFYRGVRWIID